MSGTLPYSYLRTRGFDDPEDVVDAWGLYTGYKGRWHELTDTTRLIIPIYGYNRIIGASGRKLVDDDRHLPKYKHSSGLKSRYWIYGLQQPVSDDIPILVEGFMDVWALYSIGYTAYSVLGSGLNRWKAAHLAGYYDKVICYPDKDNIKNNWPETLKSMGIEPLLPKQLYPLLTEDKIDPHWLMTHNRHLIENNIEQLTGEVERGIPLP